MPRVAWRKWVRRWRELAVLFFALPALFAAGLSATRRGWLLLPGLWTLTLVCLCILAAHPTFARGDVLRFPVRSARTTQLRAMAWRFVPALLAMTIATLWFAPSRFWWPRRRPALWLRGAIRYPLLSALPRGFIWRVFFAHPYAGAISSSPRAADRGSAELRLRPSGLSERPRRRRNRHWRRALPPYISSEPFAVARDA